MKVNLLLAKLSGIAWLKLKESDDVPAGTDTGVKPGVEFTPPESVVTQVTPSQLPPLAETDRVQKRSASASVFKA